MKPLQNLTILITRPQHQTDSLINTLKNAGAKTLYFPTLEIKPPHKKPSPQLIEHIKNSDIAIFISVNAVEKAKPYLTHLSAQSTLFAIGPTTAHTLEKTGQAVTFPTTPPFNSEALLALPKLQKVHGKTIILFAGEGGRTTLKDTLTHRGANVFKIEVYRRACPTTRLTTFFRATTKHHPHRFRHQHQPRKPQQSRNTHGKQKSSLA